MSEQNDIYFVVSERDAVDIDDGTDVGAYGYWNHGEVVLGGSDGERYEASVHVSADGDINFGDSLDTWASDALQALMGGDVGLIGRVQAAIKAALA